MHRYVRGPICKPEIHVSRSTPELGEVGAVKLV